MIVSQDSPCFEDHNSFEEYGEGIAEYTLKLGSVTPLPHD